MTDGPFYSYVALLILSGVLLAIMAGVGFGQVRGARIVDALFAAGFLGYAAYLLIGSPETVEIFFYAFAVPVLAVVNVVRSRQGRRGAPPAMPYAAPQPAAYGTGFPPPPGFPAAPGTAQQPAAALFAPPQPPTRIEPPTVDPGTYQAMPSGLAGHDGPEQAMPTGRPSGLPAAAPESFPMAPAAPGTSPSGLPRRVPTYGETLSEQVGLTQRLEMPPSTPVRDEPAGPQPLYPAYPAQPAQPRTAHEQQTAADERYVRFPSPQSGHPAVAEFRHAPAEYFEQAQAGHAAHRHAQPPVEEGTRFGRHGYAEPEDDRYEYQDQPTAGRHWQRDPEPFIQPTYRPAHGAAYEQEAETQPADWPPLPR